MPQLPPGGAAFTTPDPVEWAKLQPDGQDHSKNARDGTHSYRETWLVKVNAPNTPLSGVRASRRLPADGMVLFKHEVATDPTLNGTYMRAETPEVIDSTVAVVLRDVRATRDPYYFLAVISYEGVNDPTAATPEVSSEEVAYQEHLTFDVNGKPVMNSAFDPIDGGMPSEGFFKKVTITRNLPYDSWHLKKGDAFRKTLNRAAFVYPDQFEVVDGVPTPVQEPPGAVLIDSIREQRLERAKVGGGAAATRYYWRVSVELLIDLQQVRVGSKTELPDGTVVPAGTKVRRLHRWVVPDAGFHAFKPLPNDPAKVQKGPIMVSGHGADHPQLLDGKGEVLVPRNTLLNPIPFNASLYTSAIGGLCPDFYATTAGETLTVAAAQGVRANDTDPFVNSVEVVGVPLTGTVTLNPDGSFTYVPAAGYVGWDWFYYKPTGALNATKQVVQVFVGPAPVLLWFDRYRFSNFADIAVLLEGW